MRAPFKSRSRFAWYTSSTCSGASVREADSAFGRFTSTPCCMSGAEIMNTTRRTSMTSTSGVTLISESAVCVFRGSNAMSDDLLLRGLDLAAADDVQEVLVEVVDV